MKTHLPYHITHVYLNKQISLPAMDTNTQGNYLVFWWQHIALGQLYLKPGTNLHNQLYFERFINAIKPAVLHYCNIIGLEPAWEQLILKQDFEKWHAWMQRLFISFDPACLTGKVPVSVVICTRNRAAYLKQCLESLLKQNCLPEEIIVVDNASNNEETRSLVKQYNGVVYIEEPRLGLDIARNTGVSRAQLPIVAFVDDDVVVHPLWTCMVWETFRDSNTAAMTGLVIAAELRTESQYIFEKHWSFNRGYKDILYNSAFFNKTLPKGPPVWEIGAGANMAFRKEIFEKVGLFDELLDVGAAGCSGDSEMWYRILASGYTIHYNPRAISYHEHRQEMDGLKKQLYYYMRGFAVAALIQQEQHHKAGYKRRLFWKLPKQYFKLIRTGFPHYRYRYKTIWVEMIGVLSGLAYFLRNKKSHTKPAKQ